MKKVLVAAMVAMSLAVAACGGNVPTNYGNVADNGDVIADNLTDTSGPCADGTVLQGHEVCK